MNNYKKLLVEAKAEQASLRMQGYVQEASLIDRLAAAKGETP